MALVLQFQLVLPILHIELHHLLFRLPRLSLAVQQRSVGRSLARTTIVRVLGGKNQSSTIRSMVCMLEIRAAVSLLLKEPSDGGDRQPCKQAAAVGKSATSGPQPNASAYPRG